MSKTALTIGGYRVRLLAGVAVKPRWYEFLRRAGLRRPRVVHLVERGKYLVAGGCNTIYLHPVDYWRLQDRLVIEDRRDRSLEVLPLHPENITEVCDRLRLPLPGKV